jgi:nicotinamidase/pyrazinamidase
MKVVFWDVDTQIDFIEPTGKLYVPGAEETRPNLATLTKMDSDICFSGSVDAHIPSDSEFDEWGDHCVYGTPGQLKIPETTRNNILFVPSVRLSDKQLSEVAAFDGQVIFEKQEIIVSSNSNVEPFLKLHDPNVIVVYGVVTEICVDQTVKYLAGELGYRTYVVEDAIKELNTENADSCKDNWKKIDVKTIKTNSVHQLFE